MRQPVCDVNVRGSVYTQVHGGASGHVGSVHAKGLHTTSSDASSRKVVDSVHSVSSNVPVRSLGGPAVSAGVAGAVASMSNAQHLAGKVIDPFRLMEPQLKALTENLRGLGGNYEPVNMFYILALKSIEY